MGALKGPLVFAGILFFFSFPVFGNYTPHYYTGQYPVAVGYDDTCSACCREKRVGDRVFFLVDYIDPPPAHGCTSGCVYEEFETGTRVCFGPGEYEPECLAFQKNSTLATYEIREIPEEYAMAAATRQSVCPSADWHLTPPDINMGCILLVKSNIDSPSAWNYCFRQDPAAKLIVFRNQTQFTFIRGYLSAVNDAVTDPADVVGRVWTAGTDIGNIKDITTWYYALGISDSFPVQQDFIWIPGQPSSPGYENCLELIPGNEFLGNDVPCDATFDPQRHFFCQIERP